MTINAQDRLLPDWFTRIRTRQIALPRFQRHEAWNHTGVTQLLNTILQELPVGILLLLQIGEEEPFISRPMVGAPDKGERITEHLLDGQQRLTAIWRSLHNNYEKRTFFIKFEKDVETEMPYSVETVSRWQKDGDDNFRPFWANSPEEIWKRKMIPLDFFAPNDEASNRYKVWAKEAISDRDEREDIAELRAKIRTTFATCNLPYLSLPVATKRETALEVFIKMNTSAAPLKTYDIVVAQVEASMGRSLHDLIAAVKKECSEISNYYDPEELVLYVNALLVDKLPTNKTYLDKNFGESLLKNWDDLIHGIQETVSFLGEERIFDAKRLPTDIVVPVLVALWARAPKVLDGAGSARLLFRKYMWRAFFTSRYEKSTNSRAFADFRQVSKRMNDAFSDIPEMFDLAEYPLPSVEEIPLSGWPKQKDRLARAFLALAIKEGADDLADGSQASPTNLRRREYHHLFPDAFLEGKGYSHDEIYTSLNCALITWNTNRNISAKEPKKYLSERIEGTGVNEDSLRARLGTHLIPYDEFVAGDYGEFCKARSKLMHAKMLSVCETISTPNPD